MMLLATFLFVFVMGPLVFRLLTRTAPGAGGMRWLVVLACLCAAGALGARYGAPRFFEATPLIAALGVLSIWIGWIVVLAFVVQVLRRADPGVPMRRWTSALGAIGTTIPWFGLIWASSFST